MLQKLFFVGSVLVATLAPSAAMAQWNNQPFEFRRSAGGSAVGMSPAYRQAIIEKKLFNRRPENLVRGANGFLLDVVRGPGDSAFVREPDQAILPPGAGFGFSVGGFSLGAPATRYAGVAPYGGSESGPIFLNWSSMLPPHDRSVEWDGRGGASYTPASAVIDSWILQLSTVVH